MRQANRLLVTVLCFVLSSLAYGDRDKIVAKIATRVGKQVVASPAMSYTRCKVNLL